MNVAQTIDETNSIDERNVTHIPNVCSPIKTLPELWGYLKNPPDWIKSVINLKTRSEYVIKNEIRDCHVDSYKFVPKRRYNKKYVPKTLVCHDMMNGYLADKYVGKINIGNGYTFYRWPQIDIFVYFSHHFITIPPLSWINLSHQNGVPILGTFITEWGAGSEICKELLRDKESITSVANALVELCVLFKFNGWLINIENSVEEPTNLQYFLKYLTDTLHEQLSGGYIIWYDSVTKDGDLKWQNELNDFNKCFFDVCDGIFLNYTWEERNLVQTVQYAQHRVLDVYVGLDMFGRGTFGGGQYNSHIAAQIVRKHNLSLAIFAQGWAYETMPKLPEDNFLQRFYSRDSVVWKNLWPFLYTHPAKYTFSTFFETGITADSYNLGEQQVQLSYFPSHFDTDELGTLDSAKSICRCLQDKILSKTRCCFITKKDLGESDVVHRLLSTEVLLFGLAIVFIYTVPTENDCDYELILLIENKFDHVKKVICYSRESHIEEIANVIHVNPKNDAVGCIPKSEKQGLSRRCFEIFFAEHKILEIGIRLVNGNSLHVCGVEIIIPQHRDL